MKGTKYMAKGGAMKGTKYMAKGGAMKGTKYMSMGGAAKSEMKANPGMGKMPKSVVDALEKGAASSTGVGGLVKALGAKKVTPMRSRLKEAAEKAAKRKKTVPTGGMQK